MLPGSPNSVLKDRDCDLAAVQEFYVETPECALFCRVIGKGQPLIVLHGGPGLTQDYLLPQMAELAEHHQVIFYDQRGCGASTGEIAADSITLANYIEDLEQLRKAFGFKKISLLGHSWGGFLAMNYALTHPEAVDKLVLSNSVPATFDDISLFLLEWTRRLTPYFNEMEAISTSKKFLEGDSEATEQFYRLVFRTYCYEPQSAEKLNLMMTPQAALNAPKINLLLGKSLFTKPFDLTEDLKKLECPTLVIHGDADPIPPITADHLHESIPNSEYVLIEKCGHFPYVEKPKVYFKALKNFLSKDFSRVHTPKFLYKILSLSDWKKSTAQSKLQLPSDDADFVHFSTEDQIARITEKYWSDIPEYVILKIDVARIKGRLVYETNPGGSNKYYHLYDGSIPLNSVVDVTVVYNENETE